MTSFTVWQQIKFTNTEALFDYGEQQSMNANGFFKARHLFFLPRPT